MPAGAGRPGPGTGSGFDRGKGRTYKSLSGNAGRPPAVFGPAPGEPQVESGRKVCMKPRDLWMTRLGVVLAMAGNAVGLGNFLRFPSLAAQHGGGAFMIPYFVSLLLIGLPLMWCEWALGRYGGSHHRGSTPGIFDLILRHPAAKYLGALGVFGPVVVCAYYVYIESWTLGYAWFSMTGALPSDGAGQEAMKGFLGRYQGAGAPLGVTIAAYVFFLITFALNAWVLSGGVSRGIERLAKIGMPMLFIFALLLLIRVFTLGAPDPARPENHVFNGLGFIWNPDLSRLGDARVWLAAAGQTFFTLSLGFGAIVCYASYLRRRDDIVVTGLSTTMTNEFAEVVLGGSIAIPVAVAFLGQAGTLEVARSGTFNLGFVALPAVFQQMWLGRVWGGLWFLLLFLAGITSSVALAQPAITFMEDELGWTRRRAVAVVMGLIFALAHVPVFGLMYGALDEMDFWAGTLLLALFGFIELVVFMWGLGPRRAWEEIHLGAEIRLPRALKYIMMFVTPALLLLILVAWIGQAGWSVLTLEGLTPSQKVWRWAARGVMLALMAFILVLVRRSNCNRKERAA